MALGSTVSDIDRVFENQSFTLVELLLVVVILSVILGITVPQYSQTYAKLQLQETANALMDFMRYAQARAITRNCAQQLQFDSELKTYFLQENCLNPLSENKEELEREFSRITGRWGKTVEIPEGFSLETQTPVINFMTDGKIDKVQVQIRNKKRCLRVSTLEQSRYVNVYPCPDEESSHDQN